MKKVTVTQAMHALDRTAGNISAAAKSLGCSRQTLHNRINESPTLAEFVQDRREELVDIAETAIRAQILGGNIAAIIFTLKTRGRERGWAEHHHLHVEDWRSQLVGLLKEGKITAEAVVEELGRDLADELFTMAGISVELGD